MATTHCPYCDIEVSENAIEGNDGCCPECGSVISVGGTLYMDDDFDEDFDEFDEFDEFDDEFDDDEIDDYDDEFDDDEFEDDEFDDDDEFED